MKTEEEKKGKERGLIRNFGDIFEAVKLILLKLDVLVSMMTELLQESRNAKKD